MARPFRRSREGPPLALCAGVLLRRPVWPRLLMLAGCATGACTRVHATIDEGRGERHAYLEDAAFRRSALVASLATRHNRYAETRLEHYGRGGRGGWDALPEWNPRAEPIAAAELDAPGGAELRAPLGGTARPLALAGDGRLADEFAALIDLGRRAFFRYPVQLAPIADRAITRARADASGLWRDDEAGLGGLVRTAMADGTVRAEMTCATCHAAPGPDGRLMAGKPNAALDLGAMLTGSGRSEEHTSELQSRRDIVCRLL